MEPTKSVSTRSNPRRALLGGSLLIVVAAATWATVSLISSGDYLPLQVQLGNRSISKLPFFIALDQGLYEKYGLDVTVRMPPPEFEGGKTTWATYTYGIGNRLGMKEWDPEVVIGGGNYHMVGGVSRAGWVKETILASTDCVVRSHIVAAKGIDDLQGLKGKRIGVSSQVANTAVAARIFAERMGWDPVQDIAITVDGNSLNALRSGHVDAFLANERAMPQAVAEGYPVLATLSNWEEPPILGNSVIVTQEWLDDPENQEVARRFLRALTEGIALFHQDQELALDVIERWYGLTDRSRADVVYNDGRWISRKPYPCYDGIDTMMEMYDSNAMRMYAPEDFYDDKLIRELDESGFIDSLYQPRETESTL